MGWGCGVRGMLPTVGWLSSRFHSRCAAIAHTPMPEGVEVAIGHSYPTSYVVGCDVFSCSAVCIAHDKPTLLATFDVRANRLASLGGCWPICPRWSTTIGGASYR